MADVEDIEDARSSRETDVTVEAYLRSIPKAELHVHLEGSIQPATLLELAVRNRVELPAATESDLRQRYLFVRLAGAT